MECQSLISKLLKPISTSQKTKYHRKIASQHSHQFTVRKTKFAQGESIYIQPIHRSENDFTNQQTTQRINYKFKLDPFQEAAIQAIDNNQHVLVTAHTSSGKTVVAEHAITTALQKNQRVIYTSPIKALSNQKYRELHHQFQDVGLITGDTSINTNAGCLIMTTEILRNMLYKGSSIIKDASWVIFDEIHYMKDPSRGVVWEECIILLPTTIRMVFLSATVGNSCEFAKWITSIKLQPCTVIKTNIRAVPLVHYMMPYKADGIYLCKDQNGKFLQEQYNAALKNSRKCNDVNDKVQFCKLINLMRNKELIPSIIFCFNKLSCEHQASSLKNMDFTTDKEKQIINQIYDNAKNTLPDDIKDMPMITGMQQFAVKGIGIHHSGLLPIIKEIIEILFQEGKIKLLFTTETFAMGVNMPARSVVFMETEKYDGECMRILKGSEYIQMSGRAGRRGIDDKGYAIVMLNKDIDRLQAKSILIGKPEHLDSSFKIGFNMLLNTIKLDDFSIDKLIDKCYMSFQSKCSTSILNAHVARLKEERKAIQVLNKKAIRKYLSYKCKLEADRKEMYAIVHSNTEVLKYLVPGRVVKVATTDTNYGWGVTLNYEFENNASLESISTQDLQYCIVSVILRIDQIRNLLNPQTECGQEFEIMRCTLQSITEMSTLQVKVSNDLSNSSKVNTIGEVLNCILKEYKNQLPLLDPIEHMKLKEPQIMLLQNQISATNKEISLLPTIDDPDVIAYNKKISISKQIQNAQQKLLRPTVNLQNKTKKMLKILEHLQYTQKQQITIKGRIASCIDTANELITTELMLSAHINRLKPPQIVSLCSCLVYEGNDTNSKELKDEELSDAYSILKGIIEKVSDTISRYDICHNKEAFLKSFSNGLMEVTSAWCKGVEFAKIVKLTDEFEGSIIRSFRTIAELLEQIKEAAKIMGNTQYVAKFDECLSCLRKGIAFTNSLYT